MTWLGKWTAAAERKATGVVGQTAGDSGGADGSWRGWASGRRRWRGKALGVVGQSHGVDSVDGSWCGWAIGPEEWVQAGRVRLTAAAAHHFHTPNRGFSPSSFVVRHAACRCIRGCVWLYVRVFACSCRCIHICGWCFTNELFRGRDCSSSISLCSVLINVGLCRHLIGPICLLMHSLIIV